MHVVVADIRSNDRALALCARLEMEEAIARLRLELNYIEVSMQKECIL